MNTGLRITVFAAALAATFGTAYGVGSAVDPVVATEEREQWHGGGGHSQPPAHNATAKVDGYQVTLDGDLRPGKAGELKLHVSKDGESVKDLQPYLGAYRLFLDFQHEGKVRTATFTVHASGDKADGHAR